MVKFYKDNFNARFTWSWVDGEFVTDDSVIIEHYRGLGIRNEEVAERTFEEAKELVAPVEQPKKRGRKPKAK
jgi:hypothetical protein